MIQSPWGGLPIADAHIHFFSYRFFESLAQQKRVEVPELGPMLAWQLPPLEPAALAAHWIAELDRYGIERAVLIASAPHDEASVQTAVQSHPARFQAFAMVNPTLPEASEGLRLTLIAGHLHGICLFPAMHKFSMHDDRVNAMLDVVAHQPGTVVFVHCGVLSVGVRNKLGLPSLFDMRYSNPIDLHETALRYPMIKFIVPHFGAGYFREALMLADLCPNVYLDTSSSNHWMHYEAGLDLRGVFRRALDVVGPRRLLFGSDSSFFPRGWNASVFQEQSKALYEVGLEVEDARLIFHDNFKSLFT
jgi:predicted TIM-barrel fold metal-dependent hydrolase